MQSGGREYNGRNQYWTPSNIGLTQSMIDTSINRIELKDNTADLFTVVDNKIKPSIPIVCDTPATNEEVSNKKYADDKVTELRNWVSLNCLTMNIADLRYASKSGATSTTCSHFYLYTTATSSGSSYNKEITDISTCGTGSHIEIPIPSNIGGKVVIVNVNLIVNSTDTSAIEILGCTLNSVKGTWNNVIGDTTASEYTGASDYGVQIGGEGKIKKYSLSQMFVDLEWPRKVYLHFFYNEKMTSTATSPINIGVSPSRPNVEVTVVGL